MSIQIRKSDKCPYCQNELSIFWRTSKNLQNLEIIKMGCHSYECSTQKQLGVYSKTVTRSENKDRRNL